MNPPLPPLAPASPSRWATTVVISTTGTPKQAFAIFELLEDLGETVATLYAEQLHAQLRHEQGGDDTATEGDADSPAGAPARFPRRRGPRAQPRTAGACAYLSTSSCCHDPGGPIAHAKRRNRTGTVPVGP
jgi:hypothetical protein